MDKIQGITLQVLNNKHVFIEFGDIASADFYEIERSEYGTGTWLILESGVWVVSGTSDQLTDNNYLDKDIDITKIYQYRIRYSASSVYSDYSCTRSIGTTAQTKIGYTFKNYVVPTGEWGVIGTPDDLRYTWMFGIDMTATNGQNFEDVQLESYLESALAEFERFLGIDIRRRRYVTQPSGLTRSVEWSQGCDYTDEDDPYPFDPDAWTSGYGSTQLLHYPVISFTRAKMYSETDAELLDLLASEWIRVDKKTGQLSFYPKVGVEALGPFTQGGLHFRTRYHKGYPHGYKFDYDTGWETSDFVPKDLRQNIQKFATIMALASVGDGLLAGFSSSSISLDGLSESFSSTQSATSAYFGARIKQYSDEIVDWLKRNRYKYSNIPMGFI